MSDILENLIYYWNDYNSSMIFTTGFLLHNDEIFVRDKKPRIHFFQVCQIFLYMLLQENNERPTNKSKTFKMIAVLQIGITR